jgi:hypothetical protein
MTNPVFPTLPSGSLSDSSKYSVTAEDPSMSTPLEGGYTTTRARFTRRPRRTFGVGYTEITGADKQALEDFWDLVMGGAAIFDWTSNEDGITRAVRFTSQQSGSGNSGTPFTWSYKGIGATRLWDCSFFVQEA